MLGSFGGFEGLGFRGFGGLGFRGLGFKGLGSGCRVLGLGFQGFRWGSVKHRGGGSCGVPLVLA